MKEVVILSGKGGTGKTSIVGSFAAIAQNKVMADCDVDAADLHLLLSPSIKEENEFRSGQVAVIDNDKCIECGLCQDLCRFDAVHDFKVDPVSCEGCGFCSHICPVEAISGEKKKPHVLDQDTCIQCGACLGACPSRYAAVYRRSGELTRYEQRKISKND